MLEAPFVILMTATVDPGPFRGVVVRNDPSERARDYATAVKYWVNHPDPRIAGLVFCENSGGDGLSRVQAILDEGTTARVEWLTFEGNDAPADRHYGYSELGSVDFAFRNSVYLAKAPHFAKVTGRLTFPHLSALLDFLPPNTRWAADCRRAYRSEGGVRLRMRTELMLFSRDFYAAELLGARESMRCSHIEEFLAERMIPHIGEPGFVPRFRSEPRPMGIGAHHGRSYTRPMHQAKVAMRDLVRRFAPRIWL